ncbi:MAG: ROK family protein [Provencibacterium sp.]|nr:ROK family protein [Provencibacterium sp.]
MEAVNLFGVQRSRSVQAAAWILEKGCFSTQELANALQVSTPTAAGWLRRLEEEGLVRASGEFHSTGGRKPRAWKACPEARYSVGADITPRRVTLVAADLTGQAVRTAVHALPFSRTPAYFQALAGHIAALCADLPAAALLGVGVSIPGIVSAEGDMVLYSHALSVQDMCAQEIEEAAGAPCRMLNDANAGCIAEVRADASLRDVVYLSLSDSVGSAILIDRRLRPGRNLRMGEVGHTTLFPGGRPCYCGKTGCMDAYCRAGLLHAHTGGSLPEFFRRLHAGDAALGAVWELYLDHLAVALNNLRMLLDCDVILGGYVGRFIGDALPALRRRAALRNTFEPEADYIRACVYKREAAALGAATLWLEEFLLTL